MARRPPIAALPACNELQRCALPSADAISRLRMPRLATSSWESNDDASYGPACECIIKAHHQLRATPAMELQLRSGRMGDLATRRSAARKGPASALPIPLAEYPSSKRADSSAPARPNYAGHFAHAALQPVKAYIPRSSFRQCLTGFIHVPVAFYGMGRMGTAQSAASASEAQCLAANPSSDKAKLPEYTDVLQIDLST
ncbi:hypothetical protein T440DRAFT_484327 [Plenodomus tracheiphilus IPT5]|uniref:Uncharacterized protein n=1 Tax=Plenodomus tracheiphilus IPT5 TaxID=1408161 RepID=A0A6A7AMJ2_9PLEO|nr:hypothetical protein T440DRAFT_484327 [Plenodomus tracheiphilus IPT5]